MWDPDQYRRYADERSRPFFDLLARVGATSPRHVLDLGCGPGELTASLAARWPEAAVVGVDNSAEMLAAAQSMLASLGDRQQAGRLSFYPGDVRDFTPAEPPDVIVCNAVLQWVPGHRDLLPRWAAMLSAGGWLAIQVPANYGQPSHQILRELAGSPRWRRLSEVAVTRQTDDPGDYLEVLASAGCAVDAWETTYLHVLHGDDPVLEWYKGSGLRPVLAALAPDEAGEFLAAYASRLRAAYPDRSYGTVLPFRRVFVVAQRTGG